MLKEFESNILKKRLFSKKDNLLLAISGGSDSVILAHLLKQGGFKFSLAHCNFKLRGKDSEEDEKFCKSLSKKLEVNFFKTSFDTNTYCIENKTNVQVAARKLRYEWFHSLMNAHKFDYILTAHHANDLIETVFINLLRGTGIKGIKGIPEKNGKIIRPLLKFKKEELDTYGKAEKIVFRLDKSNLDDKYERNFIRHNIIPVLKKINPKLEDTFIKNSFHFRQEAGIVSEFLSEKSVEIITQTHEHLFINKKKLAREKYAESILHYIIRDFGFNDTQQKNILKNIRDNSLTGKLFLSPSHQLIVDRNDIIIKPILQTEFNDAVIASETELKKQQLFSVSTEKKFILPIENELLLNKNKIIFPLIIRKKLVGDKFKPFGMKGFKLLSDFLKDEKLSNLEKNDCRLLVNGNGDIIWVMGYRSDERYRVNKTDKSLLKLVLRG